MPSSENMILEMLRDDIGKLGEAIIALDERVRKEIQVNHDRHEKVIEMKGDIRVVSAKVAGVVSVIGLAISIFLKKMGIY